MSIETTVFTFKISVPYEEWAAVYDSEENIKMMKETGMTCLYKGVNKDDPTSVIVIEQGEEGKAIAMFKDPEVKPLIESAGHIYDCHTNFCLWLIAKHGKHKSVTLMPRCALNATFWRTAAAALPRHPHQHSITVPGVVQLMVTDVDVLTAVIANGEAEAFAAAAQAGINQVALLRPGETTFTRLLDHTDLHE